MKPSALVLRIASLVALVFLALPALNEAVAPWCAYATRLRNEFREHPIFWVALILATCVVGALAVSISRDRRRAALSTLGLPGLIAAAAFVFLTLRMTPAAALEAHLEGAGTRATATELMLLAAFAGYFHGLLVVLLVAVLSISRFVRPVTS
jgi:hypothetical protein